MSDASLTLTVDAAEVAPALRRLLQLGGRTPGPGIWRLSPPELTIEWKGGSEGVAVTADGVAAFRVDAQHMEALAKTFPKSGPFAIRVWPDRVRFGTFAVPKVDVADGATDLLPVNASDRDVLMLAYRQSAETIANAGLTPSVEEVRGRLEKAIRRAAGEIAWLEIGEERIAEWIDAHLRAVAAGKRSFSVAVDDPQDRQLGLFE